MTSAQAGRPAITVLARAPEPGRVKTRLAADLGNAAAAEVHEALALDVLERLHAWMGSGSRGGLVLSLDGNPAPVAGFARRARGLVAGLAIEMQAEGGLGERIEASLARRASELAAPSSRASFVVGTDAPLPSELLDAARSALAGAADVVLAPARDGGFVLLGGVVLPEGALARVPWGTDRVLQETRRALHRAGLSVAEVASGDDVDDLAGLERLALRLAAEPALSPRMSRWLDGRSLVPGVAHDVPR